MATIFLISNFLQEDEAPRGMGLVMRSAGDAVPSRVK